MNLVPFLLCLALPCVTDGEVLVAFRAEATVSGGVVTLGDVAELNTADATRAQRLGSIVLGPAPAEGRVSRYDFATVRTRLAAAGANLSELAFSGASTTKVTAAAQNTVQPAAVEQVLRRDSGAVRHRAKEAVAAAVSRHLAAQAPRLGAVRVEPSVSEADAPLLAAAAVRGFAVSGGAAPFVGSQTFSLRFFNEAEQVREVQVACLVSRKPLVLCALRALPKGHLLQADDLQWQQIDSPGDAATEPKLLIGREMLVPLRANQPVPADAVRAVPLVRSGQFVTVTSRKPGIAVQRVMKARGEGAAGELVPMLTLEDHKTILTRVTGVQEAEVVEDTVSPPSRPAAIATAAPVLPPPSTAPEIIPAAATDVPQVRVNGTVALSVPAH